MPILIRPEMEAQLQSLSELTHASVDDMVEDALTDYVLYRRDLEEAVARGDADIAAGRTFTHEEVVQRIEAILSRS